MPGHQVVPRDPLSRPCALYPNNLLRNAALRHLRTDLVFHADADFAPSLGLRTTLEGYARSLLTAQQAKGGGRRDASLIPWMSFQSAVGSVVRVPIKNRSSLS